MIGAGSSSSGRGGILLLRLSFSVVGSFGKSIGSLVLEVVGLGWEGHFLLLLLLFDLLLLVQELNSCAAPPGAPPAAVVAIIGGGNSNGVAAFLISSEGRDLEVLNLNRDLLPALHHHSLQRVGENKRERTEE